MALARVEIGAWAAPTVRRRLTYLVCLARGGAARAGSFFMLAYHHP